MSWVTITWSMIASACLTVALIYLLIWFRQRGRWVYLLFAMTATGAAAVAACELLTMHAQTVEAYVIAHRWGHVPVFVIVTGVVWFVHLYFSTGRIWLAWTVVGLRGLALVLNFPSLESLNYTAIVGLRRVTFLGESVAVADGIINPFILVGELSSLLLVVFVVDASLALWRRGAEDDRRRALVIGASIVIWILLAAGHGVLGHRGLVHSPYLISVAFLAIVAAMAYELGADVMRAIQLAHRLQVSEAALRASEQRLSLAADAAHLGMWVWDVTQDKVWATDRLYGLLGFRRDEAITLGSFLARVHPEDRERVRQTVRRAMQDGAECAVEYRILMPEGELRWIVGRSRTQSDAIGAGMHVIGACMDITERRLAEDAAHDLSGRLIHAQEAERVRVARELHDHLGQGLALLAVELEMLGQRPAQDLAARTREVQALATQAKDLASEVHRVCHELHPAKLEQLGLAAAIRGLCQELAVAYEIAIDFEHDGVPTALPQDRAVPVPYRSGGAAERGQAQRRHPGHDRAERYGGGVMPHRQRRRLRLRPAGGAQRSVPGAGQHA
jgi:PAS domain S-box-containing protein